MPAGPSVRSSAVAARTFRQTRETVRWRGGWARLGPWRGLPEIGHVVVGAAAPPTDAAVTNCVDRLRTLGFETAVTNALTPRDSLAFVNAGFEVRERLHLLEHPGTPVPVPDPALPTTRRARRTDRGGVLTVDARAFSPFWQLESAGLDDALGATPSARFRVGERGDGSIAAYAVAGRAGGHGYLQRVAVDPDERRRG